MKKKVISDYEYEEEFIADKFSKLDIDIANMLEIIWANLNKPTKFQDPEICQLLFDITQKL